MSSLPSMLLSEGYTLIRKLGEGTFAEVHEALDESTNQKVAIKQVYIQKSLVEEVLSQVNTIKMLENDHIISYKHSFYDSQEFNLNLVMELCNDSLRGHILDRKPFEPKLLQSFLIQMTSAFLQLENKELMHLDLKPQNILVANEQGTLFKLCDFGCSQISHFSKMSGYDANAFGTFNYLAPDLHFNYQGKKSRSSADVWSLGVTLYQMIFWKLPFSKEQVGTVKRKQVQDFFNNKYAINYQAMAFAPIEIINIIKLMLRPIPTDRITWKQLKEYLLKNLKVEEHQFMNMKELMPNFNKITELLIKAAKTMKAGIDNGTAFWKISKSTKIQSYETLVHYIYLSTLKFNERQRYRWHLAPAAHRSLADQLIKEASILQAAVCKQNEIDQLQVKDFNYIEMKTLEKAESLKADLSGQKGNLQFIHAVCTALVPIIMNSEGLFSSLTPFQKCFKIKV